MRKPNFFIIGAPKCGTTALSEYLRSHPRICISNPKEPGYFNTDHNLPGLPKQTRKYRHENDYLMCFKNATKEHIAIGEATSWYLYSEVAIDNILKFNPDARFIVMLRNPVELVYALHSELLSGGYEDVADFETAWNLQEERQRGRYLPKGRVESKLLLYGEVGKLGAQLAQIYKKVPCERVKVIKLEEFASHTAKVYEETLGFLGVPHDGRAEFPIINENKQIRSRFLHHILIALNRSMIVTRLAVRLQRTCGVSSFGLTTKMLRLNVAPKQRPPLPADLRQKLLDYFQGDQQQLSLLLTNFHES